MSVDLAALLRRHKPERFAATLRPLPPEALVEAAPGVARMVMLDTTAIVHGLSGRLPPGAVALLGAALRFHCAACLCEVAVGLAARDQGSADNAALRAGYAEMFRRIPRHAVHAPCAQVWTAAGLVAGTLARTQHLGRDRRKEMLNDAVIYLTAMKHGMPVLTENRTDFGLIQQVVGNGSFVVYRATGEKPVQI